MKTRWLALSAAWLAFLFSAMSAQSGASPDPSAELSALVARIQDKLRSGQKTSTDLAPELAAFDALRAKYADTHPKDTAKITELQYTLCADVLKDTVKATELRALLTTKYRQHLTGSRVLQEISMRERSENARIAQRQLIGKPAPELTFIWSTDPALKSLEHLKGKVVVLDFWATWCGPCIATFPQIRELVDHYKDANVAVIGVTSIQGYVSGLEPARIDTRGDPAKEFALMPEFIKAKNMTWTVAFTEQRVFNPEYSVLGIPHMAIIAPDGTVRHNGLHPAMPKAEKVAMIDALLREFKVTERRPAGE
jgi:thiol-disulfide isomerase/thioredoxin